MGTGASKPTFDCLDLDTDRLLESCEACLEDETTLMGIGLLKPTLDCLSMDLDF